MKDSDIHNELKNIAPSLGDDKMTEGYSVPPAYFRNLQANVMNRIHEEEKNVAPSGWFGDMVHRWLNPRYAVAMASIALLIVAALIFDNGQESTIQIADISSQDAYEYVYANITDYNTVDLLSLSDEEYIQDIFSDIEEEEIDDILDELIEEIDIESLEELF